jgi:diazepam-binding inhibitor (GABA receptor modulating acyl-CoA-binding protein)
MNFIPVEQFNLAVEKANKAREDRSVQLNNEKLLELYGLFKQATVGDNDTTQPWAIEIKKRAKWEAWNERKGLNNSTACKLYISLVEKLINI